MAATHPRFDLDHWTREFALTSLAEPCRRWAAEVTANPPDEPEEPSFHREIPTIIDGPRGITAIEQLRAALGTFGAHEPTELFIWSIGEPANPAQTKIGGVPHRPADQPWPKRPDGAPMGFLAQFCFADSPDLAVTPGGLLRKARPLPGDCLLIFAPGEYLVDWDDDQPESLHFEWQPLNIPNPARAGDVPPSPLELTPLHAHSHRTFDFSKPAPGHPVRSLYSGRDVCILKGSKIGGIPAWSQDPADLPGRHLCTLGSVNPSGERYPLIGMPTEPADDGGFLMLADLGLLYIFIDAKGRIHWTVQSG